MFKAVIFDFDGTLVDSEWAYALTDIEFGKVLGADHIAMDHDYFVGNGIRAIMEYFINELNITDKSIDELIELNDKIFLDIADDEIEVYPKMLKLIQGLHHKKIPMAVASGTSPDILEVVSQNTGLDNYITNLYSSELVENEKPLPDIFLYAAEKLGVKPEECLVFEDSQTGVTAAVRAGMKVVWLDNLSNKNKALQEQVFKYYPQGHTGLNYREFLDIIQG